MGAYLRPEAIDEALEALARGGHTILAGGTDFYPARVGRPLDDSVLDITGLDELRRITETETHVRIGALATWGELLRAGLPPYFRGLELAAREVGGVQIQNAGTVCGNVCNASPAADGVPPLLTLDAEVVLASAGGERRLPLNAFIVGNRQTARRPDELVAALLVPKPRQPARAGFLKLGARRYLVISIVMVAAVIERSDDGRVAAARVAVGACSEVAQRLPALELTLARRPLGPALADVPTVAHLAPLAPIDDVRGSAAYRRDAALTLVRRLLGELGAEP